MKKLVVLTLPVILAMGVQAQVVSVKYGSELIPSGGKAGAVLAPNWNNSASMNYSVTGSGLLDNSGAATTIGYTLSTPATWGGWQIGATPSQDADGSYNKVMLNQYLNSATAYGNPETLSLTGVTYGSYDLYVYFSSDSAQARTGTITLGSTTFSFSTFGPASVGGANALLTQTTDTTGANPTANYAVFSGLTGGSQTIGLDIPYGGGITAFQIVAVPEPGAMALGALSFCAVLLRRVAGKRS